MTEAGEWEEIIADLDVTGPHKLYPATQKLLEQLKSWGVEV